MNLRKDLFKDRREPTNGDNTNESETANLSKMLDRMNIHVYGSYNFNKFRGNRGQEAETFLKQFIAYENQWTEADALAQVENCLEGLALDWFKGARGRFFCKWSEFREEFMEMFGPEETSAIR